MNIIRVGVDIAKSVFHVHGVDRHGKTVWQAKYARAKIHVTETTPIQP